MTSIHQRLLFDDRGDAPASTLTCAIRRRSAAEPALACVTLTTARTRPWYAGRATASLGSWLLGSAHADRPKTAQHRDEHTSTSTAAPTTATATLSNEHVLPASADTIGPGCRYKTTTCRVPTSPRASAQARTYAKFDQGSLTAVSSSPHQPGPSDDLKRHHVGRVLAHVAVGVHDRRANQRDVRAVQVQRNASARVRRRRVK